MLPLKLLCNKNTFYNLVHIKHILVLIRYKERRQVCLVKLF